MTRVYELEEETAASPVVLVAAVGAATGSRVAAAALVCAGSKQDRAGLLVELDDGRHPRSSLLATAAARDLEERLVAHLPHAAVASRGAICCLRLAPDADGLEQAVTVLPLVRGSATVVHLPPAMLQAALATRLRPTGTLLRADLNSDRALTALTVRDLIGRGLRVRVLKQPAGWLAGRRALLGAMPGGSGGFPASLSECLLSAGRGASPQ